MEDKLNNRKSTKRSKVSAYIITKNEEQNIVRAIKSVQWMDEIIVLDSGSTDKTVEIAESLDAKVSYSPFKSFYEQKARAMELCKGDWTFNIDADEEVSSELRQSIEHVIERDEKPDDPVVYKICRRNRYMGRWMKHSGWYPEYRARLAKTGHARWEGTVFPEILKTDGAVGTLSGDLLHRPYSDLITHMRKIELYSSMWAQEKYESGKRTGFLKILLRPIAMFLKMYVLRAGFLDYSSGFIVSIMGAFYTFVKYARLYELSRKLK